MSHHLDLAIEVGAIFQDRYRILEELSAGGFGIVFKAEQLTTGQAVAIKCLRRRGFTAAEDQKILARFRRETRICARLHHPNIVRIIDAGSSEDGTLYTVFEYVPGRNLKQILAEEGRLSPIEARHMMGQALDALSCAHDQGIMHRDLKPANIMIVPTGARRNAMVLDFGIGALIKDMRDAEYDELTTTMGRLGTPAYSSPEQLRGEEVTPATDIYAWGLVFLECLTGQRAIPGGSVAEVMHRQLGQDPVTLPLALKGHPLDALLRMATAKNPAHRQISASELLRQLEACDLGALVLAPDPVEGQVSMQKPGDASTLAIAAARTARGKPAGAADSQGSITATTSDSLWRDTSKPAAIATSERRQITAVVCSLRIDARGDEPLDIEEHEGLLRELMAICVRHAGRAGSHVASELDERILLYFGYPRARGDDARRAVRTARRMVKEISAHAARSPWAQRASIDIQIGVHTDMVLIQPQPAREAPRISGNTARIAAQLAQSAPAGAIILSAATHELVRGVFEVKSLEPRRLGGRDVTMDVFQVTGDGRRDDSQSSTLDTDTTPLVGRDDDLAALRRQWSLARAGKGRAVVLIGEAGMGKSRLLRELGKTLRKEAPAWLECRCTAEARHSVLRPVVDMLEHHLGIRADTPEPDKVRRLDALVGRLGLERDQVLPLLSPLLSMPPAGPAPLDLSAQRVRELTLKAVLCMLIELAARAPLVLVVEDLHWADATTMELLTLLIDEISTTALLLVCTTRPSMQLPWSASALSTMRLEPLPRDTLVTMVQTAAGGKPVAREVIDEIEQRSEGVPLFVEELVRALLRSGALEEESGEYRPRKDLAALEIPATLRDLLMARLDGLGQKAKTTAQLASVLEREFPYALLQAVSWLDDPSLRACLREIVRAGIMHCRRRLSGETYLFRHVLIQNAAYESLPRSTRQAYHGRVAQAILDTFPELASARPELVAHHLAAAGQIREALVHARRATLRALEQLACEEAVGYARQAITWIAGLDSESERADKELEFLALISPAMLGIRSHGHEEFGRLVQRARELTALTGDSPHVLPTLWVAWLHHHVRAENAQALPYARDYLARAEKLGDSSQLTIGNYMLGVSLCQMGEFAEARRMLERGLALYDPDAHRHHALFLGHDTRVVQLSLLATIQWHCGQPDTATRQVEHALALAQQMNQPMSICVAYFYRSRIAMWNGNLEQVADAAHAIQDIAERHGLAPWHLFVEGIAATAAQDAQRMERALDRFIASGQYIGTTSWLAFIAESEAAAGHVERALERVREAFAMVERTGEKDNLAQLHCLTGALLLQQSPPDLAGSEASFRRSIDVARAQGALTAELDAATHLARLLAGQERGAEARAMVQRLYDTFTEGHQTPVLARARALLAEPAD